jgi:tRNA/tmRNA/rRNA uracil-C5-methylase (TrmA/RlmC/RlmD family)
MVGVRKDYARPFEPGEAVEVTTGEAVHGGWCVARAGDRPGAPPGPVLFVRHALPGETVRAVITQVTARFARADAVDIITASPRRVRPPCPYAHPGGCGGCDWQHASMDAQREIKAGVISQQLRRIAGLDLPVSVEALPGDEAGLGWRTRVRFAVRPDGRAGLRRHRSHEIMPISDCLIAHRLVTEAGVTRASWPGARWVDVAAAPATGERQVIESGRQGPPPYLTQRAAGREWRVSAAGFWQVHPGAADVLAEAVCAALAPRPGETALDLFCGTGLFAGVLADAVGPDGAVVAVEQDADAAADARYNLAATPWARVHRGDAATVLASIGLGGADIAVLDPPRTGADRRLIETLCGAGTAEGAGPGGTLRRVAYVSCDPATLARDIGLFCRHGWRLEQLRGFDAFPMTHHVECLAVLAPPAS